MKKDTGLISRRAVLSNRKVKDLPNEYWVDFDGYEGYYKVSCFFRIKSVCRIVPKKDGSTVIKPENLLKPHLNQDGYYLVTVTKDTVSTTKSLHVLMAKTFVANPLKLPEVNHIDGNKLNCLPSNLEWGTRKHNMQHAVKNGLMRYKGVDCKKKFFTNDDILSIYNSNERTGILSQKYNVTKSSIQRIKSGRTYSHITNQTEKYGLNSK